MAATTYEIVWDFYRLNEDAKGLGLIAHQFNEMGQSVYLNDGLKTQLANVLGGDWKNSEFGEEQEISEEDYTLTAWDQPFQNLLAGAAVLNGLLYYLRFDGVTSLLTDQEDQNGE